MKLGSKEAMQIEAVSTGRSGSTLRSGRRFAQGPHRRDLRPESSGKTTLALHAIAEAQKAGGTAAFVDA